MTAPRKLRQVTRAFKEWAAGTEVKRAEVVVFFSDIRQCIEASGSRTKLPTLTTYCDWLAHTSLDRGVHFHRLKRISETIAALEKSTDAMATEIRKEVLSFDNLLSDINEIFSMDNSWQKIGIHINTVEAIFETLLDELLEKPIRLPDSETPGDLDWEKAAKLLGVNCEILVISMHLEIDSTTFEGESCYKVVFGTRHRIHNWENVFISTLVYRLRRQS